MILTPSQVEIAKDIHRFRVVRAGRRFGKSYLAAEEIKGKAIAKPSNIVYFATTHQQARDIMWNLLIKQLQGAIIKSNETVLKIITNTVQGEESTIQLRGWENVETARGQAFDFMVLDEVASMRNFWMNWDEVLKPTLLDKQGEALFISTPKGFNHFYELCNRELIDKDYKSFHFTTYDNPFLKKEDIEAERAGTTSDRFAQEYLADFKKTEGLVYKEFNREIHIYKDKVFGDKFYKAVGVDPGYTHPAGIVEVITDKETFYVMGEWKKSQRTEEIIADIVVATKPREVYPDPENASFGEVLRQRGLNVREVLKNKGSVESGIQRVREMLLQGKLKVHESCINLIEEFETYSYEDKEERIASEKPIKQHDDLLDALRYVISMIQKIQEVQQFRQEVQRLPQNSTR